MLAIARHRNRAFSLIELVIVVVIIGIIAAIAIPRMSRGATGANESSLSGNLAVLRKAIDLYASEHNGKFPEAAKITDQLTKKTDADGTVGTTAGTHIFGPYIREIPKLNVGPATHQLGKIVGTSDDSGGWYYDESTGTIRANLASSELDSKGTKFNSY